MAKDFKVTIIGLKFKNTELNLTEDYSQETILA